MAVRNASVTVDSSGPALVASGPTGSSVWVQNTGSVGVTLGGPDVAVGHAPVLAAGADVGIDLQRASDQLYGVTASGSAVLLILQVAE